MLSRGLGARGLGAVVLVVLAALTADVMGRGMGWGALGANRKAANKVALTFDDGPSGRTPELLAVLAQAGVRATFFVTEPACRAFPAELAQLRQAGHQLEAHGRWHRSALLLWPWQEWAQMAWHPRLTLGQTSAPYFYRPPYGGHSPLTRLMARLLGRQIVLWDAESRDWLPENVLPGKPQELAQQTLEQIQAGSVVLLHDGPACTPELLRQLLPELGRRGWQAVTVNELPPARIGWRAGLQRLARSYGA